MHVKTFLGLTLLLGPAWAANRPDPLLVKALQDKVASQDRLISGLRARWMSPATRQMAACRLSKPGSNR
jgi:hypothetical protein